MKPKTFFKIENVEQVKMAHEKFNTSFPLETDIEGFKNGYDLFICRLDGGCRIFYNIKRHLLHTGYTEIENPFKLNEIKTADQANKYLESKFDKSEIRKIIKAVKLIITSH